MYSDSPIDHVSANSTRELLRMPRTTSRDQVCRPSKGPASPNLDVDVWVVHPAPVGSGVSLIGSPAAFFGAAFVRRVDGRFIWVHCSASSASRVHVRAMSIRISCTRAFGACAAIRWHSAARTLHLSAVSMAVPRRDPSHLFHTKPRRDRGGTSGVSDALGTVWTCQVSP